jgi:hypothetical protein
VVAQIVAASHPELLRSLVLTNRDTGGNFPPPAFLPVIEAAVRGEIASLVTVAGANPAAARMSPLATGYERRLAQLQRQHSEGKARRRG